MKQSHAETTEKLVGLIHTSDLASLGPEPRHSRTALPKLNEQLNSAFAETTFLPQNQQLIRATVLLWHDYLDESHSISQNIANCDGSFVHGMMHRREPDYWNSKYWFQRTGQHPAFPEIAAKVAELLQNTDNAVAKVITGGQWHPNTFVDLCEQFAEKPTTSQYKLLQQIQRIEMEVLLKYFCNGLELE